MAESAKPTDDVKTALKTSTAAPPAKVLSPQPPPAAASPKVTMSPSDHAKDADKHEPQEDGVNVTYIPQEGDPAHVTWNGHTFHANKPVRLKHPDMIDKAKGNPWFSVEGHDRAAKSADKGMPTDWESYRRYAIQWFKDVRSSSAMVRRWEDEESLRDKCGVGTDDLEYLNKLYAPRLAELKRLES